MTIQTEIRPGPATSAQTAGPHPHAFTVEEYYRLGELAMLPQRCELLEGIVYDMSPIGPLHFSLVLRLDLWLKQKLAHRALVSVQGAVSLPPRSEPVPDIAILKPRSDFYQTQLPQPADILLLIEVAHTTLAHDTAKAALYASHAIPEYWLIDAEAAELLAHRDPADGIYRTVDRLTREATVTPAFAPAFAPDLILPVRDIFA